MTTPSTSFPVSSLSSVPAVVASTKVRWCLNGSRPKSQFRGLAPTSLVFLLCCGLLITSSPWTTTTTDYSKETSISVVEAYRFSFATRRGRAYHPSRALDPRHDPSSKSRSICSVPTDAAAAGVCQEEGRTTEEEGRTTNNSLARLSRLISASTPSRSPSGTNPNLLCLTSDLHKIDGHVHDDDDDDDVPSSKADERGVMVTETIPKGREILRIPLSSCLRDDEPPHWIRGVEGEHVLGTTTAGQEGGGGSSGLDIMLDPTKWATRLASSFLELQQELQKGEEEEEPHDRLSPRHEEGNLREGHDLWSSMLPDSATLRASLPVHWTDEVLSNARCFSLELATDTAYFARAEAVSALMSGLKEKHRLGTAEEEGEAGEEDDGAAQRQEQREEMCHHALDIVQTRACRVERRNDWGPPLRLLAPVFDFINHGGTLGANAEYGLEGGGEDNGAEEEDEEYLVVRATRDIPAGNEVLFDYGEYATPSWKCLSNFGFVPSLVKGGEGEDDDDGDVAEVFMDGLRYEVTRSSVPVDMVLAASSALAQEEGRDPHSADDEEENPLTPAVALKIAKRVSDVAFDMVVDETTVPGARGRTETTIGTPCEAKALSLAASLRWAQHRVLLDCAVGLRDYAERQVRPFE